MTARASATGLGPNRSRYGVFISHKLEADGDLARYIVRELEKVSKGKLEVHISEDIPAGDAWLDGIAKRLKRSDLLLLLFSDPAADWDWCLFEAGFFWGHSRKIVCLHHPSNNPPSQLLHLQPLKATKNLIADFVNKLLTTNKYLPRAVVPELSKKWRDGFAGYVENRIFLKKSTELVPRLVVEVDNVAKLKRDAIPDDAKIYKPAKNVLELFNKGDEPEEGLYWKHLRMHAEKAPDNQWLRDLASSIFTAHLNDKLDEPKEAVYRLPARPGEVGQAFRAQVSRVEKLSPRVKRFHVAFIPEPMLTRAVRSFSDLMEQLHELFEYTGADERVNWLAYTPALGFLARRPEEWKRLEEVIKKHAAKVDMICLGPKELDSWHRLFDRRATDRGPEPVNNLLIEEANKVSQALLSLDMAKRSFVPWRLLPEYYLFSSMRRAIAVTPFFLPRLYDGERKENLGDKEKVEMCGVVTQDPIMVDVARRVHTTVSGRTEAM